MNKTLNFIQSTLKGPTPIRALESVGQSVWIDSIDPELIQSGVLQHWIDDLGVQGLTSNPALFAKAFKSDLFLRYFQNTDSISAPELYEKITIDVLQQAAVLFEKTYSKTHGLDGFVSLEVSPLLANDTQKTIEEARRLWKRFNRANLLVKVPATQQGVSAIRQLTAEGINVNATLLFSVERYEQVALAYIEGLEMRQKSGEAIDSITSVASFFVSRIDSAITRRLERHLYGEVGIANAKIAYQKYLRAFDTGRWERLRADGARTQRLLWASTSVKSNDLRDVLYIEELVGRDTVTTIPPETLELFEEHGEVRISLTEDLASARDVMAAVAERGVNFKEVTDQLEAEGVKLFVAPYLATLELIRKRLSNSQSRAAG